MRLEDHRLPPGSTLRLQWVGVLLVVDGLPVSLRGGVVTRAPQRAAARSVRDITAETVVEVARVEAVAYVAYAGMQAVANLTDVESRLISRTPLGAARLELIANIGAGKIAEILERMRP